MERHKRSFHHVDREEVCAVAASHSDHHGQAATWHTYLHFRQIEIEREREDKKR